MKKPNYFPEEIKIPTKEEVRKLAMSWGPGWDAPLISKKQKDVGKS